MATPEWFDPRLRAPRPRDVVPIPLVTGLRVFLALLVAGGVAGIFVVRGPVGIPIGAVSLGVALVVAAVAEPILRRERRLLRDGVAALARVVPASSTAADLALGVASIVNVVGGNAPMVSGRRLGYEYSVGGGRVVRTSRLVSEFELTKETFPEGTKDGARFVVLFDPRSPERNVVYRPRSMYTLRAFDGDPGDAKDA